MKRGSFFRTIILALATLVCCIVLSDKTNANISINVNGGAAAVTNTAPQIVTEETEEPAQISVEDIPEGKINSGVYVDTVNLAGKNYNDAMTAVNSC